MREIIIRSDRKPSSCGPCSPELLQPRLLQVASSRRMRTSKKLNQTDEEDPKHRVNGLRLEVKLVKMLLASTKTQSKKWKKKTKRIHPERSSGQSSARLRRSRTTKRSSHPKLAPISQAVERNQESRQSGHLSQKRAKVDRIAEVDNKTVRKDRA